MQICKLLEQDPWGPGMSQGEGPAGVTASSTPAEGSALAYTCAFLRELRLPKQPLLKKQANEDA